jgi:hypothetical protein
MSSWRKEAISEGLSNERIETLEHYARDHPGISFDDLMEIVAEYESENIYQDILSEPVRIGKIEFRKEFHQFEPYIDINKFWKKYEKESKDKPKKKAFKG